MQQIHVAKWGNSLGFRIPRGIVENMCIEAGDVLELTSLQSGVLISKAKPKGKHYSLAAILDSFAPIGAHPEVDFGKPRGEEIW